MGRVEGLFPYASLPYDELQNPTFVEADDNDNDV